MHSIIGGILDLMKHNTVLMSSVMAGFYQSGLLYCIFTHHLAEEVTEVLHLAERLVQNRYSVNIEFTLEGQIA